MRRGLTTIIAAALLSAATAQAGSGDGDISGYAANQTANKVAALKRALVRIPKGGTLAQALADADVPADDAHEAITALRSIYDPRRLRSGQHVTMLFEHDPEGRGRFAGLEIAPDTRRSLRVTRRGDEDFATSQQEAKLESRDVATSGVIKSSLIAAGKAAGAPYSALMAMINVFGHEVDFQRDIQPGDRFELLYEQRVDQHGRSVGGGRLLYGALELSGRRLAVYRFAPHDERADFFDHEGQSVRRALLATPIDGARLTSGFGMRRHPILGYSKMHAGVDFGAPSGTPIYAAGSGVVEEVGAKGAYGNYIRIRHNSDTATAYAHLSRYAKGLSRGARVDQGDVIGYVGSTGRSTGPHLHYEVLQNGKQINPRSLKTPTGERLSGRALAAFQEEQRNIVNRYAAAGGGPHLASSPQAAPKPARKPADG
ncbi:MAG TPA: M23 family metallopeptidase [Azospirillaceae bacterium]|nr:M23 family metallopeptidase [Azospirillaceae bacterium]HRQ83099.1 M23 family metallopeptidase [Azospirillaceae bacterium]